MKRTLVDLFENSVKQYPDNPFLWEKTTNKFEPTTYTQVREQVYTLGAGLVALGVMKGDNMALLSEGRNAWIIGELAMFLRRSHQCPPLYQTGRGKRPVVPSDTCRCKIYYGIRQPVEENTFYRR